MASINIATDIPSQINSLEELAAWALWGLAYLNPDLKNLRTAGQSPVLCASIGPYRDGNGSMRIAGQFDLPLAEDYGTNGLKIWKSVDELSNVVVSSNLKTN